MEFERAARADTRSRIDGWLLRIEGHAPDHPAQHQPAGERCCVLTLAVRVEPDTAGHAARQHHAGRRDGQLQLQRPLGDGEPATCAWPQFNASYTWSKSLDYKSLSSQGIVVQNSYVHEAIVAYRISTRATASSSARSTSCHFAATSSLRVGSSPRSSRRRAAIRSTSSPATSRSTAWPTHSDLM